MFYNPITEENSQMETFSENDVTRKHFEMPMDDEDYEDDHLERNNREGIIKNDA